MKKEYIAIDLGATSGRVILCAVEESKTIEMETLHRFPTPLVQKDGKYYWDIFKIRDEIAAGLSKASGKKIESIGIDTWGVDFCIIDNAGELHMPRAYRDPYTTPELLEEFFAEMPREELYSRTGIQIMNFNSVFQLFAQRKEGLLDNAARILFVPDAISYLLTGKEVCEYTILSTSALMNPVEKEFDSQILKLCGLSRAQFPQIVLPGTVVGELKPEFGLGPVKVVAVAGHDTASAVAAVPAMGDDFAYLSSGTWSLMGIETPQPVINGQMAALNFTNEGGAKGNIRLLKNITGMWLVEQCLSQWRKEGRDYRDFGSIARECAALPGNELTIDVDAREFASPTDMPAAITAYCKANGIPAPESDMGMLRLIYDSLAAKYANVFGTLCELSGKALSTLHIIGGGSQNALLNQLTADACGVRVVAGPAEGTALGNLMIQAGLNREDIAKSIEIKTYIPRL